MGEEQVLNKEVVRRHFSALSAGDADAFAATHDPDGVNHAPAPFDLSDWPSAGKPFGPAEARETLAWLRAGSPDLNVDVRHAHRFRLRGGRIVEHWAVRDDLRAMLQAGVVTPPDRR